MEGPDRGNKAEQESRREEQPQESEQLLKFHRRDEILAPSLLVSLMNVYVLFVATITGIGVLAYYSHWDLTRDICLIASVILILIVPFAAIWYLFNFRKKPAATNVVPTKQTLMGRITQSSVGNLWLRLANKRISRRLIVLFTLAQATGMIVVAIIRFPVQPRFSLAQIVFYMAMFLISLILEIVQSLERRLRGELIERWKREDKIIAVIKDMLALINTVDAKAMIAVDAANSARGFIIDTEPGHQETHKNITAALNAIQHTTEVMAGLITK
jgi:hypothetical protein